MAAPPPPPPYTASQTTTNPLPLPTAAAINTTPQPPSNNTNTDNVSSGILITVLILAIAVILSASLYLLLRFFRHRRLSSTTTTTATAHHHHNHNHNHSRISPEKNPIIDSLPLFPFDSLTGSVAAGDCAVCLSKFEKNDLLRLLPICCHAFHVECIDTWLAGNHTCPLCRSSIFFSDDQLLGKLRHSLSSSSLSSSSRSFRVEIGNVSRRVPGENSDEIGRSYSISGSYDYVVENDAVSEVPMGSFQWPSSEFKTTEVTPTWQDQEALANEVGPRGGWLKDYLSTSSSRTASFRGSGRWFFGGSSRRDFGGGNRELEVDMEAGQLGDEIGELFRWLSGV